jgi:hypothetical protein
MECGGPDSASFGKGDGGLNLKRLQARNCEICRVLSHGGLHNEYLLNSKVAPRVNGFKVRTRGLVIVYNELEDCF